MSRAPRLNRKLHRLGAIVFALPILVILGSGVFLQLKKEWAWVQPPTAQGSGGDPTLAFDDILAAARSVAEARVETWEDVDRLDVRPGRGLVKVRANSGWEVQVDTRSGAVLQVAYRRSDLIESIHDGSFFHDRVKLWLFLPSAFVFLGLWGTGIYLWLLPHLIKRRRREQK